MYGIDENKKVFIYSGVTDMRLGIYGLIKKINKPEVNGIYAFCGKDRRTVKILEVESTFAILHTKRLFKGKVNWPTKDEVSEITIKIVKLFIDTADEINKIDYKNLGPISLY